jgi:hypothetical protein
MSTYEVTICDDNGVPDWSQMQITVCYSPRKHERGFSFSPEMACQQYIFDQHIDLEDGGTINLAVRNHGVYEVRAFLVMDYAVEKLD